MFDFEFHPTKISKLKKQPTRQDQPDRRLDVARPEGLSFSAADLVCFLFLSWRIYEGKYAKIKIGKHFLGN